MVSNASAVKIKPYKEIISISSSAMPAEMRGNGENDDEKVKPNRAAMPP